MIFGYKDYIISSGSSGSFTKFYRAVTAEKLPVRNMREKDNIITLRLSAEYCGQLKELCGRLGLEYEIKKTGGPFKIFGFFRRRPGFIAGGVIALAACIYFSNIVVRFDILCDNKEIYENVMNVLKAEGIETGTYIPNINLVVTERALKQQVEGISWAGITRKGNSLIVDVIETEGDAEREQNRYPSNLVACEDGIIEKVEVQDGQLKLGVGCGVTKGDIVVSGEIITEKSQWIDGKENVETKTSYARAKGKIYGTFERTMVFDQPLSERTEFDTGEKEDKRFFSFYSADIPLFLTKPEGSWKSTQSYTPISLFGIEMPFGITNCELTEYDFKTSTYSQQEALDIAHDKAYIYEKNFLSGYEIKDRQAKDEITDEGVKTTVTYTLYGEMCREVEFFIKK